MSNKDTTSNHDWLSDTEYKALLNLYHEFHSAFIMLPDYMVLAFFTRLNKK